MERQDIFSMQRTAKGLAYEKAMADLDAKRSADSDDWKRAKESLYRGCVERSGPSSATSVYSSKTLQSMSLQYANDEYIGDRLMPMINVGSQPTGNYFVYDKRSRLAYPPDELGEYGEANEIDDARSSASYSCKDYGFSNKISRKVVDAADAPLDEMLDLTEAINEGIAFKREKRQAAILTTSSNFGSNTSALGAADRWDSASGGNPIKDFQTMKAALWTGRGPGVLMGYCPRAVWDVLARHPQILDLFKFSGSNPGLATPDMLARWFGLAGILVGDAREDTANKGQTASYSRIWGTNTFGMVRVASRPSIRNAAFGYTFRLNGAPKATQWFDATRGYDGVWKAKVAISDDYKVVASDTGYLLTTVVG